MAVQTSYPLNQAAAYEGMVANSEPRVVVTRIVEGAAGIGFGKVAVRGTADNQIKPAAAAEVFLGITIADPGQVGDTADMYPQYEAAAVMTKGVVWVIASVAVAAGDPVYYVPATGVLTNVATDNEQILNGVWDSSTSDSNALAKLRLA